MAAQTIYDLIDESLNRAGIDLEPEIGVKELAWKRNEALKVISALRGTEWAVLGGDVLEITEDGPRYTHDNWRSEPHDSETGPEFTARSCDEAERYISEYRASSMDPVVFVLVGGRVM